MIIEAKDLPVDYRTGERLGTATQLLTEAQMHNRAKVFAHIRLRPGSITPLHQHVGTYEAFYFLAGEGEVDDNGTKKKVKAGDVMFTDDGEFHAVENTGSIELEYIALVVYS